MRYQLLSSVKFGNMKDTQTEIDAHEPIVQCAGWLKKN